MATVAFYFDGSYVGDLSGKIVKEDKNTYYIDLGDWGIQRYFKRDVLGIF